jgi:hypothetical protein
VEKLVKRSCSCAASWSDTTIWQSAKTTIWSEVTVGIITLRECMTEKLLNLKNIK